eukprot:2571056-Rhodomonas_salina.1
MSALGCTKPCPCQCICTCCGIVILHISPISARALRNIRASESNSRYKSYCKPGCGSSHLISRGVDRAAGEIKCEQHLYWYDLSYKPGSLHLISRGLDSPEQFHLLFMRL